MARLRGKHPNKRILVSKPDVSDAFRNLREDPVQAHSVGYVVRDLMVIDFRLTFGWSESARLGGLSGGHRARTR